MPCQRTLTLVVSGMLWERSLVMKDLETESLWSHLLGEAMAGPLVGAELETLPAVMTDWETWKARYPQATVAHLPRTANVFHREIYDSPERFVLGYAEGGAARAWPFDELSDRPLLNDEVDGAKLLVVFEERSGTGRLYGRTLDGQVLSFVERGGAVVDKQTGSTWDQRHFHANAGPLAGEQLKPLPGVVSFRRAWEAFHPESSYYGE